MNPAPPIALRASTLYTTRRLFSALFFIFSFSTSLSAQLSISIEHAPELRANPITSHTLDDVRDLLAIGCNCPVAFNNRTAKVRLLLPLPEAGADSIPSEFAAGRNYPYFHYPRHGYRWNSREQSGQILLNLESPTFQGIANGLYGLLQEKLGFYFVHPRETVYPCFTEWPLPPFFSLEGRPVFDKKGFHLHTMHPIELTEPLLDPDFPGAQAMVREYIDWLARNQQNFFDFNLLETPSLPRWVLHARQFVDYAHERGILCSIDISLHMVQQKAFKLVEFPPKNLTPFKKQIDRKLDLLLSAGFDFINMEFAIAEFVGGMERMRTRLRSHVEEKIAQHPHVKLVGRQHVVREEDEMGGKKGETETRLDDPARGTLIHTVMCYALTDSSAPVYELSNFSHQLELLRTENKVRETWFYPESAYWVTFDNSVPMLLLPYLDARLRDIQTARSEGIPGHITFSSGWEWGYWMIDWSIARWSWDFAENGKRMEKSPLMAVEDLFPGKLPIAILGNAMAIQQRRLLQDNMLRYLCPPSFTDELPNRFRKQFQPRPEPSLAQLYKDAPPEWRAKLEAMRHAIDDYGVDLSGNARMMRSLQVMDEYQFEGVQEKLWRELADALEVTGKLAEHHGYWYMAFEAEVYRKEPSEWMLGYCERVRQQAMAKVLEMEEGYRYPVELIARERRSHTAYAFGYLYPVSDLHFWQRREEQLIEGRFDDPFFMNIWDAAKIAGFKK